jgi:glycerol-3-phosphate acyltransferase PlsY
LFDCVWVGLAYGLGCFQTGYYLVRWSSGKDLRTLGSGATGARNAGRLLGHRGFILTLAGDVGKGALAVALACWFGHASWVMASAAVAVTVGHIWPVQLKFSGGRGVAVTIGAWAVLDYRLLGFLALGALLAYAATRRVKISGLVAYAVLPAAAWTLKPSATEYAAVWVLCVLVLFAHRSYLVSLLFHREGTKS